MSVAVITGASRGIGHAIAVRLSCKHDVLSLSRSQAAGIRTILTDVRDPDQVRAAFDNIVETEGIPDVLINCAGYVEPQGLFETTLKEWRRTIDTNLTGTFLCTQQFARHAKSRGGKVINIASTAGMRAQPGWLAYAASKAAVINFSLSVAEELRPYGIRVYCLAPGRCATELRRKLAPDEDPSTIMQPGEVAAFVQYLVDDGALLDQQVLIVRR